MQKCFFYWKKNHIFFSNSNIFPNICDSNSIPPLIGFYFFHHKILIQIQLFWKNVSDCLVLHQTNAMLYAQSISIRCSNPIEGKANMLKQRISMYKRTSASYANLGNDKNICSRMWIFFLSNPNQLSAYTQNSIWSGHIFNKRSKFAFLRCGMLLFGLKSQINAQISREFPNNVYF